MARPVIGRIKCPFHERPIVASVKKDKNGSLYYWCPGCGPVQPHGDTFGEWMLDNAEIFNPSEKMELRPCLESQ